MGRMSEKPSIEEVRRAVAMFDSAVPIATTSQEAARAKRARVLDAVAGWHMRDLRERARA
jgi:hypothetical protein